ncbi:hypothetical protein BDZ90DRAFT_231974 [Jaminaea rosea]|uniref:Ribosome biogenesis protein NSA1 n=1 Tax=Jaminaea rosea TaxID=1569628 RepID=A0A316UYK5_9BASI|nr:hypothetical protein BDZ90DRAFT_231974 [Jaminaea rosea]PWN28225.1 hypothetical protein BDZ90DRAFT_231974 [Jaminaea rosea]
MTSMDSDEPPATAQVAQLPPSYRFFLGDAEGQLKSWSTPCPPLPADYQAQLPQVLPLSNRQQSHSAETAVQRMASGIIEGIGFVLAIARRNATIDVVLPPSASDDPSTSHATLLVTIKNDKMKAGLQRWVGLAVGSNCIYAATSAGNFTKTVLSQDNGSSASSSSSSATPRRPLSIASTHHLTLPEPLQSLVFHPASNPTSFLYGGEEIPLSIWNIETAFSTPPSQAEASDDGYTAPNGEEQTPAAATGGAGGENAKMRKRKRQAEARAKAKELLWGEVWRAKNLPNDALSLPQRPNITSIAVLADSEDTPASPGQASSSESPERSSILKFKVAVGTRDGLLRVFDPSSGSRKQVKEFSIAKSTPIKALVNPAAGSNEGELLAADGEGKLSAVDVVAGKLKYQWKDITGAIASVVALPPPTTEGLASSPSSSTPLAVSSSLDRLLRLHTFPSSSQSDRKKAPSAASARGQNLLKGFTGGAAVTAIVWDGAVPIVTAPEVDEDEEEEDESMNRGAAGEADEEEEDGDDDEGVWEAMQEVGEANGIPSSRSAKKEGQRRSKRLSAAGPGGDEEGEDVGDAEEAKEERAKRTRKAD